MSPLLPEEFEKTMRQRLAGGFESFKASFQQPPPVSIRLNPLKPVTSTGELIPWCPEGRYLSERPSFTLDPLLHGGGYYVQEASSMFIGEAVNQLVNLRGKLTVLDLCAAPGGKSTHVVSLLSPESMLVSNEVIRNRTSVLSENLQKWGLCRTIITQNDPAHFSDLEHLFDLILVDAPCSGEGLFRKDPKAMDEWSPSHTQHCSLRQRRIVQDVWPALKPGGILLYTTCTYNDEENINTINFLRNVLEAENPNLKIPPNWGIETVEQGGSKGYQFFPHLVKGEGFFLSALKKNGKGVTPRFPKSALQNPPKQVMQEIQPWIHHPESKCFFLHHQTVRMLPSGYESLLQLLLNRLTVVAAGTGVAEIMRNKLIPDHSLALSTELNPGTFHIIDTDETTALSYLRKDILSMAGPAGFALIRYEGLGLGWVNLLPNRVNNLYPAAWRIRMGG